LATAAVRSATAIRNRVSEQEWHARVELAAFYRIVSHFGMTDSIFNHISLRVPDEPQHLLVNPYGLLFDEITASSLVKVDCTGAIVLQPSHGYGINPAVPCLHGAVLAARPDLNCIAHVHTPATLAVSAMEGGLRPLNQAAMRFIDDLAYHDYCAPFDPDEPAKLVRAMCGTNNVILRNHGVLCCGRAVPEAFLNLHYMEFACKAQALGASSGVPSTPPPGAILNAVSVFYRQYRGKPGNPELDAERSLEWQAARRLVNRIDPSHQE
jgi:ribulose-5-phosphate 4-epimerase/fuculose-1-phosphate aldolase